MAPETDTEEKKKLQQEFEVLQQKIKELRRKRRQFIKEVWQLRYRQAIDKLELAWLMLRIRYDEWYWKIDPKDRFKPEEEDTDDNNL